MADMDLLNLILNQTLACACQILDTGLCDEPGSKCGCPCRAFITAGTPVWDLEACCGDGQLAVWSTDIFAFNTFPNRSTGPATCSLDLAASVSVQLLRCWPANVKDDGSAPTAAEIQKASEQAYRDQFLLTWGVICCLKQYDKKRQFVINGSRIIGPQGGCIGVQVDFTVEITDGL